MSEVATYTPINMAAGGDTLEAGVRAIEAKIQELRTKLNLAQKLHGGAEPTGTAAGELWLDATGDYPIIKRSNGANPTVWANVLTLIGGDITCTDSTSNPPTYRIGNLKVLTAMLNDQAVTEGKIAAGAVSLAKMASIDGSVNKFLGRKTASTGAPEVMTPTEAREALGIHVKGVTTNFSKTADETLEMVTGLQVSLSGGRTYAFAANLFLEDASTQYAKVAVSGTASASAVRYRVWVDDEDGSVDDLGTQHTALGDVIVTASEQNHNIRITGMITVASGGTFGIQFAQNASTATPSRVLVGSTLTVQEVL